MTDVAPTEVAVIGAGPAGLMAAEVLAEGGARVTVYDAMPSAGRSVLVAPSPGAVSRSTQNPVSSVTR